MAVKLTLKEKIKHDGAMKAFGYIYKDPETNIPKLLGALQKLDDSDVVTRQSKTIENSFLQQDGNWRKLILSLWTDIDHHQFRELFESAVVNGSLIGSPRQKAMREKCDCNIPWAILMDPTSACNLRCTG